MPTYFENFPKIEYQLGKTDTKRKVTDITKRIGIRPSFDGLLSGYYKSILTNGERPEILSFKSYGTPNKHWVLLHANNIIDPIHDWVKPQEVFEEYVDARYPNRTVTIDIKDEDVNSQDIDKIIALENELLYTAISITDPKDDAGSSGGIFSQNVAPTNHLVQESDTGVTANFFATFTSSKVYIQSMVNGNYFTKGKTITDLTTGDTATVSSHKVARAISVDRTLSQITYKMISPSESGISFTADEGIITDRNVYSTVVSDVLEKYAPKYYEITRTNSDETIDRLITNKTLTSDEQAELPDGFKTNNIATPTEVTNIEHEYRVNIENATVDVIDENYLKDFDKQIAEKLGE